MYVNEHRNTHHLIPDLFTRVGALCVFQTLKFRIYRADPVSSIITVGSSFLPGPVEVTTETTDDR